jgi:putative pyruvate formate lyase activating enzyme
MNLQKLWEIHDKTADTSQIFSNFTNFTNSKSFFDDEKHKSPEQSLLDLKIEIAHRLLQSCEYCENLCHVNRTSNQTGRCEISDQSYLSSAFLHMGEEAPLIPSGTLFFAGCTFNCCFCQNHDISSAGKTHSEKSVGTIISPKRLADIAEKLGTSGAKNINYVGGDPTPHLYTILASMEYQNRNICQLWNSNFYNTEATLRLLIDVIDLWLPDFKYGNNQCGEKLSDINSYFDVITRNLRYIYNKGSKSIIIRHLAMPNHIECCSKPILQWVSENIPNVLVNIMNQYHPDFKVNNGTYPEINRRVSAAEMKDVFQLANSLGINYRSLL